ncbi:mRNA-decapping enzyme 1B-like [Corticium candelabrum]|uniref:mRNA-decapping enzyme 1B-like n=1 Tax=Corticium candelabrum TaxID=121492 RepID=UPI002E263379|nr:mRNA-decapping enzyme 1B-like [Corticium candelabrum]
MANNGGESERTLKAKRKEMGTPIGPHESKINLTVLKRCDETIVDIVGTAGQVALYRFVDNTWHKTDVEGTLFVFKRSVHPIYGFLIMNRLNTENVQDVITATMEFQTQQPFVLYKSVKNKLIYGIWFYDSNEFQEVGNLIVRLSQTVQPESHVTPTPPASANITAESSPAKPPFRRHQLLTNGSTTSVSQPRRSIQQQQQQQQQHNTQKSHPQNVDQTAAHTKHGGALPSQESLAALDPAIMALPSSLADMKVSLSQNQPAVQTSASTVSLQSKLRTSVMPLTQQQTSNILQHFVATAMTTDPSDVPSVSHGTPSHALSAASSTTHLRSPLDFQLANQKRIDLTDVQRNLFAEQPQEKPTSTTTAASGLKRERPALDREQFQQAMLHLIQNDKSFVDVLHDAYIKSIGSFSSS